MFFISLSFKSQIVNYFNNGGFEILNSNAGPYSFESTKYWGALDTTKSSNYLCSTLLSIANAPNVSTGFQYPRAGNNFIGTQFYCDICTGASRFYPRNRLKQTLQAGKTYCAKYHVVNTNTNRVAINSYGMYFGDISLDTITQCMRPITYLTPQVENNTGIITDTLNWVPITGTFVATGNEKYMVLGNFRSNATTNTLQLNTPLSPQTADIYIDDVSVIDYNLPAYAGPDIFGIRTTTVYLGRPQDVGIDEACMWYHLPNNTTAIDTAAGITITVAATTQTYMVKQDICGNIKYDTVVVYASGTGIKSSGGVENGIKLFPNPVQDILRIQVDVNNEDQFTKIEILNSLGQIVKEEVLRQAQQPNGEKTYSIKTDALESGVYFLNLISDKSGTVSKRFVISR